MEMMNEMELSPKEYFDRIKDRKNTMTSKQLDKFYENCLELANKYYTTGQVHGLRKILFLTLEFLLLFTGTILIFTLIKLPGNVLTFKHVQ